MIERVDHDVPPAQHAAALGAAGLLGCAAAHQAALAAGAPWGDAAYGGRAPTVGGVLQPPHRWVSASSAVALGLSTWVVAMKGGLVRRRLVQERALRTWTWAAAGVLAANTVANMTARHPAERWGLGTLTATTSALCVIVARSPGDPTRRAR